MIENRDGSNLVFLCHHLVKSNRNFKHQKITLFFTLYLFTLSLYLLTLKLFQNLIFNSENCFPFLTFSGNNLHILSKRSFRHVKYLLKIFEKATCCLYIKHFMFFDPSNRQFVTHFVKLKKKLFILFLCSDLQVIWTQVQIYFLKSITIFSFNAANYHKHLYLRRVF